MVNRPRRGTNAANARGGAAQTPAQRQRSERIGESPGNPTKARAANKAEAPERAVTAPEQCKAVTKQGTRCRRSVTAPSKNLCGRHQGELAKGGEVRNFETGRKFPAPRTK